MLRWGLPALLLLSLALRLVWLGRPATPIFDETYYVNAARVILHLPQHPGSPWRFHKPGVDPNLEHPPLAKLFIAASIRALGDNPWGWRLPGALLGTLCVLLVYWIARKAGGEPEVSLFGAFVFAFDTLVFIHARIATLDVYVLAFLLLGLGLYLSGRPVASAGALVLSTLCKIQGAFGVAALVLFEAGRAWRDGEWRRGWGALARRFRAVGLLAVVYLVGLPVGLGLLDARWGIYKNPFRHLRYVLSYGLTLDKPQGSIAKTSQPWQWLIDQVPMLYHQSQGLLIRGIMNPAVIFACVPAMGFAVWAAFRRRDEVSMLAAALFVGTYAPLLHAALFAGRISYIYYFLPSLPAVALAVARLVHARAVPAAGRWAYAGLVIAGFVWLFPVRP